MSTVYSLFYLAEKPVLVIQQAVSSDQAGNSDAL